MATPGMITITGSIKDAPNAPDSTSRVLMEQEVWLIHTDGTAIKPRVYDGAAASDGTVSFAVPPTDDPAWRPQNWTFRCQFVDDEDPGKTVLFRCVVPYDAPGATVTLGSLVPVGSSLDGAVYAPINHTHPDLASDAELSAGLATRAAVVHSHPVSQITERIAVGGEFVIPRRDANSFVALDSDILYATHFVAQQTMTIQHVRTTVGVAATGTTHAWLGFLRWDVGVGYTPLSVSVDDPTRWSVLGSPNTPVFAVDGFGSAVLGDPGFDMVAGQEYAFTLQWVGSGTKPQLRACPVNIDDAFTEPRENGYMGLSAPPSGLLQPGWLVGSAARFQGFLQNT